MRKLLQSAPQSIIVASVVMMLATAFHFITLIGAIPSMGVLVELESPWARTHVTDFGRMPDGSAASLGLAEDTWSQTARVMKWTGQEEPTWGWGNPTLESKLKHLDSGWVFRDIMHPQVGRDELWGTDRTIGDATIVAFGWPERTVTHRWFLFRRDGKILTAPLTIDVSWISVTIVAGWILLLGGISGGSVELFAWLRRRRLRKLGLCPWCRYDMKGLPGGSQCPECGKAAPSPAK